MDGWLTNLDSDKVIIIVKVRFLSHTRGRVKGSFALLLFLSNNPNGILNYLSLGKDILTFYMSVSNLLQLLRNINVHVERCFVRKHHIIRTTSFTTSRNEKLKEIQQMNWVLRLNLTKVPECKMCQK